MRSTHRVLALCLFCLLPLQGFAEAPVVDDSENFAALDAPQVAHELPVTKVRSKYSDTEEEMALAQDNEVSNSSNMDMLSKLKGMQQEIQELRGQLEVQSHELKQLQDQQLAFYKDIDARFRGQGLSNKKEVPSLTELDPALPKTSNSSQPTAINETPTQVQPPAQTTEASLIGHPVNKVNRSNNPADEQIAYLAAYDLVKNKRYNEALVAMESFVSQYPKGGYTANAQYWLGELYLVQKDYSQAINHFELVLNNYANSSKAAACSLKIGYALASSGKKEEAKYRLQQVIKKYPDTPTAQLAVTKLMSLNAST